MSARLRKRIVGALAAAFLLVVAFGPRLFGHASGVVVLVLAFVTGFAWLRLLVAPWVVEGRNPPRR